jgi:hypothetical protein
VKINFVSCEFAICNLQHNAESTFLLALLEAPEAGAEEDEEGDDDDDDEEEEELVDKQEQ